VHGVDGKGKLVVIFRTREISLLRWIVGIALVLLTACARDVAQERICRRVIPWFEGLSAQVEILHEPDPPQFENSVLLDYRVSDGTGSTSRHWLACRFAGGGFMPGRYELIDVMSDRGELSAMQLAGLRALWLEYYEPLTRRGAAIANTDTVQFQYGYLLQQIINGLVLACVYGLPALGYTLIYASIGRINLAFGEMAMLGAYVAVLGSTTLSLAGSSLVLILCVLPLLAAVVGAGQGWLCERLVFRPLRAASTQAPLIATIGLSLFYQEYVRLAQGARDQYLQPV